LLLTYVDREKSPDLIAEPTKLYPTKNKVQQININKMAALTGEEKRFLLTYRKDMEMTKSEKEMRRQFTDKDVQLELDYLAGNLICEKEITLKVGAQVMCIVNFRSDTGDILICNGSQGIIKEFCPISGNPKVKYNNGIEMIMFPHPWVSEKIPGIGVSQVPLILSWALTIHKCQGATLDAAEIDAGSGIFECGQTYVALSRVKSLDGLYLTSFDPRRIQINKKVKEYYSSLRLYHETKEKNEEVYVPLVIAEEITTAIPVPTGSANPFIDYQYVEAQAELVEEKYDEPNSEQSNVKIINLR